MRVHLAEIAGAYASEIAEGADLGDDNQLQPSAFGPVASRIPGLSPAFRLSPADTYRFLTTFAATDTDLAPFEAGLGNLARRLVDHNVPLLRRTGDPTQLSAVFAALGNVRGFELAAAEAVRGRWTSGGPPARTPSASAAAHCSASSASRSPAASPARPCGPR